jgi:hypothetical protein
MITVERAVILRPGADLEVSLAKLKPAAAYRGVSVLNRRARRRNRECHKLDASRRRQCRNVGACLNFGGELVGACRRHPGIGAHPINTNLLFPST